MKDNDPPTDHLAALQLTHKRWQPRGSVDATPEFAKCLVRDGYLQCWLKQHT